MSNREHQWRPNAQPARQAYRRDLPHIQFDDRTLYVTFTTAERWTLPMAVREVVLRHCLHDHGTKLIMRGAVVMPDHVHLLFTPQRDDNGATTGLRRS